MTEPRSQGLLVIGATAAPGPDELPQFLDPVCSDPNEPDICYIAHLSPWDESAPRLQPVTRQRFEEECEGKYWLRLSEPLPFRWDYRLVALRNEQSPSYLFAEELYDIVRTLGVEALQHAEMLLDRDGLTDEALSAIWYAARAIPENPFPLLAAIAIERNRLGPETLSALESDLPPEGTRSPLVGRARQDRWQSLLNLVTDDPLGSAYFGPDVRRSYPVPQAVPLRSYPYLVDFPNEPRFFSRFLHCFATRQLDGTT